MATASLLDQGRDAFARKAWGEAYAQLQSAGREAPLPPEDLERLAMAAHLLGRDGESGDLLAQAHNEFLKRGEIERAARVAIWLSFSLQTKGELAQGGGWIARARRLLEDAPRDCVEHGYLLVPDALRHFFQGDPATARAIFAEAVKIGERFGERDLIAMGRHGQGRALIRMGKTAEGVALLDEVMVAITTGEVSAIIAGDTYCSVIEACHEIYDLRRAQEWTTALNRWCDAQPDMVPYRGSCLVRRAEILQLHGEWPDAIEEARLACDRLAVPPGQRAIGSAYYQLGELHRLRGEFDHAEEAYREAGQRGRKPEPGLAQLRLIQGRVDVASRAIRRAVDEAPDRRTRSRLLPAYIEITLAEKDVAAAKAAALELARIAGDLNSPYLHAASFHATGAVALAEGDCRAALSALRRAANGWRELGAPYEAARAGALIGVACRELGDLDAAEMELEAACRCFQQLGALPDLARLRNVSPKPVSGASGGLTAREVEVLTLVATGRTNRAISASLGISEKTVARHVSNIFTKLGLSSRAAATAYAYQQQLVRPHT